MIRPVHTFFFLFVCNCLAAIKNDLTSTGRHGLKAPISSTP